MLVGCKERFCTALGLRSDKVRCKESWWVKSLKALIVRVMSVVFVKTNALTPQVLIVNATPVSVYEKGIEKMSPASGIMPEVKRLIS